MVLKKTKELAKAFESVRPKLNYKCEFASRRQTIKKVHYHEELRSIQTRGGIEMALPFESGLQEVLVQFPIAFIVGDTIGNDKLCSRYQTYVATRLENTGVSRDCTCIDVTIINVRLQTCHDDLVSIINLCNGILNP